MNLKHFLSLVGFLFFFIYLIKRYQKGPLIVAIAVGIILFRLSDMFSSLYIFELVESSQEVLVKKMGYLKRIDLIGRMSNIISYILLIIYIYIYKSRKERIGMEESE